MFNLFRSREKSTRILLGAMLLMVAASMLVYLVPGGFGGTSASGENIVASVAGDKITTTDVQRSIQGMTRGQNLPKGLLAMYLPNIVNQLVESKAMAYKAKQMGLTVSDQELSDTIQAEFAAQLGGKFDMDIYKSYLNQMGLTTAQFEEQQRDAILASRLEALEGQALVVSDADARKEYERKNLKVGLQYIDFEGKDFLSKVNRDPAALKAYFDKNRAQFKIPEKRDVDLIVGSTVAFLQSAKVSENELQKQYQDSLDSFRTPERVRIRHILIKTQGKPKEQAPAMKARAEDLLKQIKAGGNFADLARKNSEDPGSAEKGGDLGWVTRGQMVPNFEKSAFSLKPGEISGVVETEYGYHILQCEERQDAHTQTFEEARPLLFADAQKQQASDNLKRSMDAARDEIARTPSQAAAIAAKYNLQFFKLDGMTSSTALPDVSGLPQLSNAIFSTPKGGVTDVVDADKQSKAAFAAVLNIIPTRNAEFAEVQDQVTLKFATDEAAHLAAEAAKTAAARLKKGDSLESIAKEYNLPVKTSAPFTADGSAEGIGSGAQLSAAFKANVGESVGPLSIGNGNFICKVTEKIPADMSQFAQNKAAIVDGLAQQRLQLQAPLFRDSIVADLKKRGKIKLNDSTISRMIGALQG